MADEIRYGIIGCGMMGQEHLRNLLALPGARVVALADPHAPSISESLDTIGSDHRVAVHDDHRWLLDSGVCDAVVVATPNMTHAAVLADVLAADVHVLVEKCCHFFDLMHHITQATPVRVFASGGQDVNHLDERYEGETPDILDNAYVVVDYDDGARAVLDLCMFAEGSEHAEEVCVVGDVGKVEAFLPSSEVRIGRREHGSAGVRVATVHDARIGYEGFHHGASYLEHVDFLEAVCSGQPAAIGPREGLWSVAVGVAAHRSIDEGRVVLLDEVLAST